MGIDDILREKDQRQAREREEAKNAFGGAQARVDEFQKRVTEELLSAIRALNDPALGTPEVQRVSGPFGVNKRSVQIECRGSVRVVFMTTVSCADGAKEATCSPIEIRASRGGPTVTKTFQPTPPLAVGVHDVPESMFGIDQGRLKTTLHEVIREL